jgi:Zn-dependent peptidase ImmA (M78 family)
MEHLQSKKDIENISHEILRGSKSLDVFPTPIDKIIQYSDLVIAEGIDLKSLEKKYKTFFFSDALRSGLSKVRGFLDRSEKLIYLDLEQKESRQSFVKLHETGHSVLPWQKQTLQFLDDDETLDPDITEEFEAEANYFASITLFQNDRFVNEVKKYELGIPSALQVSKHFGASGHATLRRYVETSKHRCALLVLESLNKKGQVVNSNFRNAFHSQPFVKEFGHISWPEKFGYKWEFMKDHTFNKRMKLDGAINLDTANGKSDFHYHFFNNTFNGFVLIFPKGESKKTRTKIILKNA